MNARRKKKASSTVWWWAVGVVACLVPGAAAGTNTDEPRPRFTPIPERELSVKFHSPRGFLIDAYQLPIGKPTPSAGAKPKTTATGKLEIVQTDETITVKGNRSAWVFDRKTGMIREAQLDGRTVLVGGPVLMILPLKGGQCAQTHRADIPPFNETCTQWQASTVKAGRTDEGVEIRVEGKYKEAAALAVGAGQQCPGAPTISAPPEAASSGRRFETLRATACWSAPTAGKARGHTSTATASACWWPASRPAVETGFSPDTLPLADRLLAVIDDSPTKLQLAARLVEWITPIVKKAGKTLWVVVDDASTSK